MVRLLVLPVTQELRHDPRPRAGCAQEALGARGATRKHGGSHQGAGGGPGSQDPEPDIRGTAAPAAKPSLSGAVPQICPAGAICNVRGESHSGLSPGMRDRPTVPSGGRLSACGLRLPAGPRQ